MTTQKTKRKPIGKDLASRVAVVTGASRGVRGQPTTDNLPGTIEDTADEVTRRGGTGIPVRCDHSDERQVEALFQRVRAQQGRLDILVNNAWGGYEGARPMPVFFWQAPLAQWDGMVERGVKAHVFATYFAVPLMMETSAKRAGSRTHPGLIVSTVVWDHDKYIGSFYDLAKHSTVRFLWGLAMELRDHNIATIALAPGFMRTERVMSHASGETDWKKVPWLKRSESPEYLGRAVAALAGDARVMRKSGKAFHVGELAREYDFTDVDGRRVPPYIIREPFVKTIKKFQKSASALRT